MNVSISNSKSKTVAKKKCPGLYKWTGDYGVDNRNVKAKQESEYLVVLFFETYKGIIIQPGISQHKEGEISTFLSYLDKEWELCSSDYVAELSN